MNGIATPFCGMVRNDKPAYHTATGIFPSKSLYS